MSCITITPEEIINLINTYVIPYVQNIPINDEYFSGTLNDMTCSNLTVSGSGGNTTTDGYYYTYSASINNIKQLFDLEIVQELFLVSVCPSTEYNTSLYSSLNYKYTKNISINVDVQTNSEAYIPEVTAPVCAVCCCGDPISSCCYDSCDCTNVVTTPSSYDPDLLIPTDYTGTVSLQISESYISLNYIVSSTKPTSGTFETIPISTEYPDISPIYIYNLNITSFTLNIQSISLSGIPEPQGGLNISGIDDTLNTYFAEYILPTLNTDIETLVLELTFG